LLAEVLPAPAPPAPPPAMGDAPHAATEAAGFNQARRVIPSV
jgi:hypothetical protein